MRVGIPTETKNNEFRVAITPAGVAELTRRGHEVLIQAGAGEGSAITDADFSRRQARNWSAPPTRCGPTLIYCSRSKNR